MPADDSKFWTNVKARRRYIQQRYVERSKRISRWSDRFDICKEEGRCQRIKIWRPSALCKVNVQTRQRTCRFVTDDNVYFLIAIDRLGKVCLSILQERTKRIAGKSH